MTPTIRPVRARVGTSRPGLISSCPGPAYDRPAVRRAATSSDHPAPSITAVPASVAVELEAVRARTTTGSTLDHAADLGAVQSERRDGRPPAADWPLPSQAEIAVAAFVGLAVAGATGEPAHGAAAAVVVLGWERIRRAIGRAPWSFGDGFLGYRADLGRARGVQEDDDFHWTWG